MPGNSACKINYFCLGAVVIFLGSILLCTLGFTVVLPHQETIGWPEAMCHVTNVSVNRDLCSCHEQYTPEDRSCVRKYPCLEIMVQYTKTVSFGISGTNPPGEDTRETRSVTPRMKAKTLPEIGHVYTAHKHPTRKTNLDSPLGRHDSISPPISRLPEHGKRALLRNDADKNALQTHEQSDLLGQGGNGLMDDLAGRERDDNYSSTGTGFKTDNATVAAISTWTSATLFRKWTDAFYEQCSIHECGEEEWNIKETTKFRVGWGSVGQKYRCYYDPARPHIVILKKTGKASMIHAVVWPVGCLSSGAFLWICLCCGCCKQKKNEDSTYYTSV